MSRPELVWPEGRKRVSIFGSRNWPDRPRVRRFVRNLAAKYPDCIVISGGAPGVDETAEQEAIDCGLDVASFRPERCLPDELDPHHGEAAPFLIRLHQLSPDPSGDGFLFQARRHDLGDRFATFRDAAFARNYDVAFHGDELVAFHHLRSAGTADTLRSARRLGKSPHVYDDGWRGRGR
jgi:hypothetical protein